MWKTKQSWEDCSEGNTSQLHLRLQKRSCSGSVPNITGGETGSGAIALQKLNPPTEVKRGTIVDCSGTGTKPWRVKRRSAVSGAAYKSHKSHLIKATSCFLRVVSPSRASHQQLCLLCQDSPIQSNSPWSPHWGTGGKKRSGGENRQKKLHAQMGLDSWFLHPSSGTWVF